MTSLWVIGLTCGRSPKHAHVHDQHTHRRRQHFIQNFPHLPLSLHYYYLIIGIETWYYVLQSNRIFMWRKLCAINWQTVNCQCRNWAPIWATGFWGKWIENEFSVWNEYSSIIPQTRSKVFGASWTKFRARNYRNSFLSEMPWYFANFDFLEH